jgi:hypothetical protein
MCLGRPESRTDVQYAVARGVWITRQAKAKGTQGVGTAVAALFLLASAPAFASSPKTVNVKGSWANPVPPLITAYDTASGRFSAVGSSVWTGSWNGPTSWTTSGTINLLTGDAKGTLDETFIGRSDDGGTGTLHFTETYTIDGAKTAIYIDARLLSGTGDFTGSRGHVIFVGTELPSGQGEGTYTGIWKRGQGQGGGGGPKHQPGKPQLHLTVSPRTVSEDEREDFQFTVRTNGHPVSDAKVSLNGRQVRTNRHGRATLITRLARPGRYPVVATHSGMRRASTVVRAVDD